MDLILCDGFTEYEESILKSNIKKTTTDLLSFKEFDFNDINNYKNITIYTSLFFNFVSKTFISLIEKMIENQSKKVQIDVIFVENLGQNAKIAIDWINSIRETYSLNISVISEIDWVDIINKVEDKSKSKKIKTSNKSDIKDGNNVTIYTDGACSGNPGAGGWGAILFHGSHKKEISGFEPETTNNKMEITAVIKALEMLKEPCIVELYSDSAYVVNAINLGWLENWKLNGWKGSDKKPVKNIEYWKRLDELMQIHFVLFNKVKGHSDNEYNNRCDELATGEIAKNANVE